MQSHDEDILKRVRRIEIKTRGLSDEIFAGKYHTAFRGRGMSFAEVREYRVGDDVRDIDWNVTARSDRAHVKVYEEEREPRKVYGEGDYEGGGICPGPEGPRSLGEGARLPLPTSFPNPPSTQVVTVFSLWKLRLPHSPEYVPLRFCPGDCHFCPGSAEPLPAG